MEIKIKRLSDFPAKKVDGHQGFLARSLVNVPDERVTVRLIEVAPGGVGPVPSHSHPDGHFFLVLDGTLELEVDGHLYIVPSDCCIEVPPGCNHQLRCPGEAGMTVLAMKWN